MFILNAILILIAVETTYCTIHTGDMPLRDKVHWPSHDDLTDSECELI